MWTIFLNDESFIASCIPNLTSANSIIFFYSVYENIYSFIYFVILHFILSTNKMTIECLHYTYYLYQRCPKQFLLYKIICIKFLFSKNYLENCFFLFKIIVAKTINRNFESLYSFAECAWKINILIQTKWKEWFILRRVLCVFIMFCSCTFVVHEIYFSILLHYFPLYMRKRVSKKIIKNEKHFIAFYLSKYFDNVYYYF